MLKLIRAYQLYSLVCACIDVFAPRFASRVKADISRMIDK